MDPVIRQPEFVDNQFFQWAAQELNRKKPELLTEKARLETWQEGLCVQMMHIGPYASEPESMAKIEDFLICQGLRTWLVIAASNMKYICLIPAKPNPRV